MLKRKIKHKHRIKPKRIFDEMAEYGLLEEMLETRLKLFFEQDPNFRSDMMEILFDKSPDVVPIVELLYLENLCEDLGYFLGYTQQWRKQKL